MNQKAYCPWLIAAFSVVACSNAAPATSSAEAGAGGSVSAAGAAGALAGQPSSGSGGAASGGAAPSAGGAGASAVAGAGGAASGAAGVAGSAGNSGASGSAGASGNAGSAGAAGAAGSSSACSGLLCEDFEQGMIDPAKWDLKTGGGGTAVVESTLVAHGKYALQVHALGGQTEDYAQFVSKNAPAALNGTHFGRANFYITPKPLTSGHTSMVFAGRNGTGSANGPGPFQKLRYMEVSNIHGGWQAGFDLLDISPLVEKVMYPAGSPQVPTTAWTCLEWQFSDAPDSINFWIDGKLIGTFDDQHVSYPSGIAPGTPLYNGSSTGVIGGYELFGFGFHDWHPSTAFDLYYDDIVLDTKRVNCLP
ncbi:MAG TPA: hypothetical protein VHW01_26580 [Polyangiaceae bacterium]|jgi:hypothetical protein|nr:hypothetical protein [Polyangiaceae bacterium]